MRPPTTTVKPWNWTSRSSSTRILCAGIAAYSTIAIPAGARSSPMWSFYTSGASPSSGTGDWRPRERRCWCSDARATCASFCDGRWWIGSSSTPRSMLGRPICVGAIASWSKRTWCRRGSCFPSATCCAPNARFASIQQRFAATTTRRTTLPFGSRRSTCCCIKTMATNTATPAFACSAIGWSFGIQATPLRRRKRFSNPAPRKCAIPTSWPHSAGWA